jgi:hypothetical protein
MLLPLILAIWTASTPSIIRKCAYFTSRETGVIGVDNFGGNNIDQLGRVTQISFLVRKPEDFALLIQLKRGRHVLKRAAIFEQSNPRTFLMEGLRVTGSRRFSATMSSREQDMIFMSVAAWHPLDASDSHALTDSLRQLNAAVTRDRKAYPVDC